MNLTQELVAAAERGETNLQLGTYLADFTRTGEQSVRVKLTPHLDEETYEDVRKKKVAQPTKITYVLTINNGQVETVVEQRGSRSIVLIRKGRGNGNQFLSRLQNGDSEHDARLATGSRKARRQIKKSDTKSIKAHRRSKPVFEFSEAEVEVEAVS